MNKEIFLKPPPAEPIGAEDYLNRTDRAEVGRSAFFHGRDAEYDVFRNAAIRLNAGDIGGGTMIFQGAPGAGKSALMLECMEAVKRHSTPENPWIATSIKPNTLTSAVTVIRRLVHSVNKENERLAKIVSDPIGKRMRHLLKLGAKLFNELSERGIAVGGVSVGGKSEAGGDSHLSIPAEQIFMDAAPLLEQVQIAVFVDEAQNISVNDSTRDVINCLHNPPMDIPLVAAFFGLSDTKQVLRECGLSRIADERVCNLEPLSIEDATASLRCLIDTYYAGSDDEKTVWANALAELSQGWPQHINRVGVAAGRVLRSHEKRVQRHLLEQALERGAERKNAYYQDRVEASSGELWAYRQLAPKAAERHGSMADTISRQEIMELAGLACWTSRMTVDEFLTDALHAGLLAPAPGLPDHYKIPIPSLGDYLRSLPVEMPQASWN